MTTNKLLRDLEAKIEQISLKVDNISLTLNEKPQQSEEHQGKIINILTDFPIKNEEMLEYIENILKNEAACKNLVSIPVEVVTSV